MDANVQQDAERSVARFRGLLESVPDGIVMVNPEGRIGLSNTQAEQLFGYASGELLGQPVERFLPPRFREGLAGHCAFDRDGLR